MPNPIHEPNYSVFREMLVRARKERGLRQEDLAEHLGKPQSFISKYERGERRLDFVEFLAVAETLNVNVTAFIRQYREKIAGKSG